MLQLLEQLLQGCERVAAAATSTATPPATAALLAGSWTSLAAQPNAWRVMVLAVLRHVAPQDMLMEVLQEKLSTAARCAPGIMQLCDILAALGACGHADLVVKWVSSIRCDGESPFRCSIYLCDAGSSHAALHLVPYSFRC